MTAQYHWNAGEPRHTPAGRILEGTRDYSYCSFRVGEGADGELAACLNRVIRQLLERESKLQRLRSSGGDIMLLTYWHAEGDEGEEFHPDLLGTLARLGVTLGLNVLALAEVRETLDGDDHSGPMAS